MTALIVIAAIVLVFAVLFMFSIRAELSFLGGKFDFRVKYMFFTIIPRKKKPKKTKDKAKKDKTSSEFVAYGDDIPEEENAPEKLTKEDEKLLKGESAEKDKKGKDKKKEKKKVSLGARIEQGKIIWDCVNKPLKRLFGGIFITDLVIDFTAGGEDAYAAGMNYGKMNAIVYNAISAVRFMFPVTVKTVDINVDFDLKKSVYDAKCSVRLRLGTAVAVLLTAGIAILINWGRLSAAEKGEADEEKKQEARVSA